MDLNHFECLGCGTCCRQDGYVRLREDEPDRIAEFLGMDVYEFIETFTLLTRDRQTLSLKDKKEGPGHDCIFLSSAGCRIHPVKPAQCRDFPRKWKFKTFGEICAWAKGSKQAR